MPLVDGLSLTFKPFFDEWKVMGMSAYGKEDYVDKFHDLIIIFSSILIYYVTKKNLVYPTIFSAIILSILNSYIG